jgi:hypothetical protein
MRAGHGRHHRDITDLEVARAMAPKLAATFSAIRRSSAAADGWAV